MVTFRAIGGLGNQLFVLAAALAHSEFLRIPISVDLRRAARGFAEGGPHSQSSSLLSFKLNETPMSLYSANHLKGSFLDHLGSLEHKLLELLPSISRNPSRWCHTSAAAGYDPAVFDDGNIKYFRGYFQSYKYLQYLRLAGHRFDLTLVNPSLAYLAERTRIEVDPYTVIHIRRGDYIKDAANFGLLSRDYYSNALDQLFSKAPLNRVLLFSDDSSIAEEKEFEAIFEKYDVEYIETTNLDPAEVLLLMAGGSSFVIANSSFSWWAAALSESADVYYPATWFRDEPQPLDLAFPFWRPVQSSWLA